MNRLNHPDCKNSVDNQLKITKMKKSVFAFCKSILLVICSFVLSVGIDAQPYTNTYNGIAYTSDQPYNLNVVYFVANDVALDPAYQARLSALLLWGQDFTGKI